MSMQALPVMPQPPHSILRPGTFNTDSDATFAKLPEFVDKYNQNLPSIQAALDAAPAAVAAAAYKGTWSSLAGSLAIPASVTHGPDAGLYMLLETVADVTAHEPGVSSKWKLVSPPTTPIGSIVCSASHPGNGWLECNGAVYLQSSYTELYVLLGLLPNSHNRKAQGNMAAAFTGTALGGNVECVTNSIAAPGGTQLLIASRTSAGPLFSTCYRATGDGTSWSTVAMPSVQQWTRLAVGGSRVLASINPAAASTTYATSDDDGATWTVRAWPASAVIFDVAYGNGVWVAARQGGTSWYSADGVNWTAITGSLQFYGVAFGNGVFVGMGTSGQVYTSTDGIAWTQMSGLAINSLVLTTANKRHRSTLIFANGAFFAVGNEGSGIGYTSASMGSWQLLRSTDGVNWTAVFSAAYYFNGSGAMVLGGPVGVSDLIEEPHLFSGLGYVGITDRLRGHGNGYATTVITRDGVSFEYLQSPYVSTRSADANLVPAPFAMAGRFFQWTWDSGTTPIVLREQQARITYSTSTQFAVPHLVAPHGLKHYIKAAA